MRRGFIHLPGVQSIMGKNMVDYKSEWPSLLITDEAWLKIRRVLVHSLEREGLWMNTKEYLGYKKKQKTLGDKIKDDILNDMMGQIDHEYLNSEEFLRGSNIVFKERLPYIAAFGYESVSLMSNLVNANGINFTNVAKIGSIFNVGTALFDSICDTTPDLFCKLKLVINYKTLSEISNNENKLKDIKSDCDDLNDPELRLILKFLLYFYYELYYFKSPGRQDEWEKINALLINAFLYEIRSNNFAGSSKDELLEVSRNKSVLPFELLYFISRLSLSSYEEPPEGEILFIGYIGELFWLLDDLSDLISDLENNELNSLITQLNGYDFDLSEPNIRYSILVNILDGKLIEEWIDKICLKSKNIIKLIEDNNSLEDKEKYKNFIKYYLRDWIT
jgi:hypothetical protein